MTWQAYKHPLLVPRLPMPHDDAVVPYEAEVRRFREAVTPDHEGEFPTGPGSAVLAPLVPTPIGMCLLLERRPAGNDRFAGHLCFPGGRIEPDDASPLAAALRESEEEIGFVPDDVEVLGHLIDTYDPRERPVSAFVGLVPLGVIPASPASPVEVDEMILVPIADLRGAAPSDTSSDTAEVPHLYRVTGHETRRHPNVERTVHYWPMEKAGDGKTATLWGFTAGLTALMLERVFDWRPTAEPRMVERWDEMLP